MALKCKTRFEYIIRLCACCLVAFSVFVIIGVNVVFNMTGHWTMPAVVPGTFEKVKSLIRVDGDIRSSRGTIPNRTLVNVYEGLRKGTQGTKTHTESNKTIDILWYNKPVWINLNYANRALATQCTYANCHMTDTSTLVQHYAAIIFCLTSPLGHKPPIPKDQRNPNQVWVYFGLESPVNYKYFSYRHNNWQNTMNWSMTYNLDADIFFPYGMLETRSSELNKDYNAIFAKKTKFAAWFVSNCGAPSQRDDYVAELKSHGVDVDIHGRCADDIFHSRNDLTKTLNSKYKFYLSFENSLCKDYVTEKFFRYYNFDIVLVVRGGSDYDRILPNGAFIDSSHFGSAEKLAQYLIKVGSSAELYTSFLRRKDQFVAMEMSNMPTSYCALCQKLNNINEYRKSYIDHVTTIHDNTCWNAPDVHVKRSTILFIVGALFVTLISLIIFIYVTRKKKNLLFNH